jgi:hypothetical protein
MVFLAGTLWPATFRVVGRGAASANARWPGTKIRAPYPDSARGLKQQLEDMRELARRGRSNQLQIMINDFEIPNAQPWYVANFGKSGLKTADYYKKDLTKSEEQLKNQMIEFAREDGYFSVKKQKAKKASSDSAPSPDVFLAAWEHIRMYGEDPYEAPVGYFYFIDGKFRWDSTIKWVWVD